MAFDHCIIRILLTFYLLIWRMTVHDGSRATKFRLSYKSAATRSIQRHVGDQSVPCKEKIKTRVCSSVAAIVRICTDLLARAHQRSLDSHFVLTTARPAADLLTFDRSSVWPPVDLPPERTCKTSGRQATSGSLARTYLQPPSGHHPCCCLFEFYVTVS